MIDELENTICMTRVNGLQYDFDHELLNTFKVTLEIGDQKKSFLAKIWPNITNVSI